tara:strand:+ start:307 stop:810 length:504 start_codon:yes stop_codon:yes gene_type:complete
MIFKILVIFLFISNLSYSDDKNQLLLHKEQKKIDTLNLLDISGQEFSYSSETNKVILINFWATWCAPCIKEIPELIQLKKKFKNEIEILFISVDQNAPKVVPKFLEKNNLKELTIFNDQNLSIAQSLGVKIMPTTIILNKSFEEISRISGYINWLDPDSQKFIENIL